ncbi:hypothetical protein [Jiangella asiatica]|nr:hypothetical protein [Jiangella asiatica]
MLQIIVLASFALAAAIHRASATNRLLRWVRQPENLKWGARSCFSAA